MTKKQRMEVEELASKIGRLAMRVEGTYWVAYYTGLDSMQGASEIGRIRMKIVTEREERKEAFFQLMREAVGDLLEEYLGQRPVWGGAETGPEAERSGNV